MLTMEFDYNEALKIREEEATERGLERGLEQGLERGRRETKLNTLVHLLSKKFSTVPNSYQHKLTLLEQDQLDRILDDIFDLRDIRDLDKYLTKA